MAVQAMPKVEFMTERSRLVAGREQTLDVLLRVSPPEPESSAQRRPKLNLGVVLDRSGSMGGEKIRRAREAAAYCIDQLLPTDRLSLVVFDDVIEVLIPSQLVENKASLKEMLSGLHARSSTALHEAWVRGGLEVSEHLERDAINRVLLITDGQANVGLTNTDEIVTQALELHKRGVSTSTIGIGADFNEDLLMPMAQSAGGNAWHVDVAEDMQRIFAVELEGLIAQLAHTVTLGVVPSDGVRLVDVLNDFELNETGRYRLPNLQAGSPLDVVLRLRVPAQAAGTKLRLVDLRLGFTPQEARSAEVLKQGFEVEFASESVVQGLSVNTEVTKAVQMLMNARARREAVAQMDAGQYDAARGTIQAAYCASESSFSGRQGDADVAREFQKLEEYSSSLVDRSQDKRTRKMMSYDSLLRRLSKRDR